MPTCWCLPPRRPPMPELPPTFPRRRPGVPVPLSVWPVAQTSHRAQRIGRYLPCSAAHPARMLPALARHAIERYTQPGELVIDPMCGIGTTLVEAVHLGRHAVGVELEPRWVELAERNLARAMGDGAPGIGTVAAGDARQLPRLLAGQLDQRAALGLTSPPYGSWAHGRVRRHRQGAAPRRTGGANRSAVAARRGAGRLPRRAGGCRRAGRAAAGRAGRGAAGRPARPASGPPRLVLRARQHPQGPRRRAARACHRARGRARLHPTGRGVAVVTAKPAPGRRPVGPGLRLQPARYVALTPEQEREAITALARLLALVRERDQDEHDPDPTPES